MIDLQNVSIAVITPSNRDPKWQYIVSMNDMINRVNSIGVMGTRIKRIELLIETQCSGLSQGRQNMLDAAMLEGFTHALFIDDDMTFPPDMLDKLFGRFVKAIGVNALRKDHVKMSFTATDPNGEHVNSNTRGGISLCLNCGLGIFLIDLDVVRKIPRPHFEVLWNEAAGGYVGEDRYFINKIRERGTNVYIDHDVSRTIGHVGDFNYCYENMRYKA